MRFEVTTRFKENWGSEPTFDELMSLEGEIYRQVTRRKTFKFNSHGKEYFAKIHKGVGWREIFKNIIQGQRPVLGAIDEYNAINALIKLGVNTMTLAAFGQRGHNIAEIESFVITESLEPSISLEDYCMDWVNNPPPFRLKKTLISLVANCVRTLHEHGINHRDLYICHFLLKLKDIESAQYNTLRLYLIDLHRVQIRHEVPRRWQVKDLAALYFSSMDIGLTKRDIYRFIKAYSGMALREAIGQDKRLWQEVEAKGRQLKRKPIVD